MGGVPLFKSWETAVTSCAGANGLVKRMLLGTPCEPHSSVLVVGMVILAANRTYILSFKIRHNLQ